MKSKAQNRKKKPYSSPRLVAYGDFRTLTRSKGGGQQRRTREAQDEAWRRARLI